MYQVIEAVNLTGLRVVVTISDRGTANVELHDKQRLTLVHIYDVPHLLKCIRNNLLTEDLAYTVDNNTKYAKWSHLKDLYHMDSAVPDYNILLRLTDQHIVRDKIGKMKNAYLVRSSIGSKDPNCHAFASAYKTLVLNNLVSFHSPPGYSCEEDLTEGNLSSFTNFFESAIASTSELGNQMAKYH
ncbi:THAP-type domain-containing protein [Aphis craccivora]|uniref:THAP-type domain-containing protein n=1 Tax=Aphis craccivora TaxID=307492 RepID=A0A6G0Y649_APHCR|nr:THAP-type domain-containing protein [Aphis craccivora]